MDVWTQFAASPRGIVKVAQDAEAKGWDGLSVVDSQNLSGDPFVALAMAGAATEVRARGAETRRRGGGARGGCGGRRVSHIEV